MRFEQTHHSPAESAVAYVWYASYGSNLSKQRFDCYLQGTRMPGQRYGCAGARDASEPVAVDTLDVPHRLFFARESPRWGGGLAFMAPQPKRGANARLRLYKITLEQFNDVLAQENKLPIPLADELCMTPKRLDKLAKTDGIAWMNSPYGYLKCLGHRDHCPVLTFTCSPTDHVLAHAGTPPWQANLPSRAYYETIRSGLIESGMAPAAAQSYLSHACVPLAVPTPTRLGAPVARPVYAPATILRSR